MQNYHEKEKAKWLINSCYSGPFFNLKRKKWLHLVIHKYKMNTEVGTGVKERKDAE